jgi:hypothetical protein
MALAALFCIVRHRWSRLPSGARFSLGKRSDLPLEVHSSLKKLLLLRLSRVSRGIRARAGHAANLGKLLINALELVLESLTFFRRDRRRCGLTRLGAGRGR